EPRYRKGKARPSRHSERAGYRVDGSSRHRRTHATGRSPMNQLLERMAPFFRNRMASARRNAALDLMIRAPGIRLKMTALDLSETGADAGGGFYDETPPRSNCGRDLGNCARRRSDHGGCALRRLRGWRRRTAGRCSPQLRVLSGLWGTAARAQLQLVPHACL